MVARGVMLPWVATSSTASRPTSTCSANPPVVPLFSWLGWPEGSDGLSLLGAGVLSLSWHFTGVEVGGLGSDSGLGLGLVADRICFRFGIRIGGWSRKRGIYLVIIGSGGNKVCFRSGGGICGWGRRWRLDLAIRGKCRGRRIWPNFFLFTLVLTVSTEMLTARKLACNWPRWGLADNLR